jgi:hypothetical protein
MIRVGFDVDGVLANFGRAFLEQANHTLKPKVFDLNYQPATWEWREVMSSEEFGRTWRDAMAIEDWWLNDIPPTDGLHATGEYYHTRHDRDAEIWFISSRGQCKGRPAILQTELWLMRHLDLEHAPRVIIVPHAQVKRELVKALELDFYIDDYAPTIMSLTDVTHAYLLERSWNATDRASYKIPSVPSVEAYIERLEKRRAK